MRLEILTWVGDIAALAVIVYLIVNVAKFDRESFISSLKVVLLIWIGMKIPLMLPQKMAATVDATDTFICSNYRGYWWQCAGWPIFYKEFYLFVQKVSNFFNLASTLPIFIVLAVTYWYILNRLSRNIKFSTEELIATFFGSIVIYVSLLAAPLIIQLFSDGIITLAQLSDNEVEGKRVLATWFQAYEKYKEFGDQGFSSWNWNASILRVAIFIPFALITILNSLIIIVQFILTTLFPVGLFKSVMDRTTEPNQGFKLLYMLGLISAFSAMEWTIFSWLPELTIPTDVNDSSILEILGEVTGPSILITVLMYFKGAAFFSFVAKPAFRMFLTMRYL